MINLDEQFAQQPVGMVGCQPRGRQYPPIRSPISSFQNLTMNIRYYGAHSKRTTSDCLANPQDRLKVVYNGMPCLFRRQRLSEAQRRPGVSCAKIPVKYCSNVRRFLAFSRPLVTWETPASNIREYMQAHPVLSINGRSALNVLPY